MTYFLAEYHDAKDGFNRWQVVSYDGHTLRMRALGFPNDAEARLWCFARGWSVADQTTVGWTGGPT